MKMILAVMYREFRIRFTNFTWAFFDLVMPLIYLMMFGVGLDRAMSGGIVSHEMTVNYQTFFLPGVLSMACFGIAINTSYGFFVDRDNGILYEFLTYPMTRGEFLIGKIVFNCLLSVIQTILTVFVGVTLLDVQVYWPLSGIALAGIVLGTAGWFFCLTVLALRVRRSDTFNTLLNIAYFVLMFASTIFYPIENMPGVLRWLSYLNPLTWHTDVLRYAISGMGDIRSIMLEALAFTGFMMISFWLAVRSLQFHVVE